MSDEAKIPPPSEEDYSLDLWHGWGMLHRHPDAVPPHETYFGLIRRCHAAETERDQLRADLVQVEAERDALYGEVKARDAELATLKRHYAEDIPLLLHYRAVANAARDELAAVVKRADEMQERCAEVAERHNGFCLRCLTNTAPAYSTDFACLEAMIAAVREKGWMVAMESVDYPKDSNFYGQRRWCVTLVGRVDGLVEVEDIPTLPLAFARAALLTTYQPEE